MFNRYRLHQVIFLLLIWLGLITSCSDGSGYKVYQEIGTSGWHIDSAAVFPLPIEQTTYPHKLGYIDRNTIDYPFSNLYVRYQLVSPEGDTLQQGIHESDLMDPKTGRPYGKGSGGIYEHDITLLESFQFPDTGQYVVNLQQYMRMDTLPSILTVGLFSQPLVPEE